MKPWYCLTTIVIFFLLGICLPNYGLQLQTGLSYDILSRYSIFYSADQTTEHSVANGCSSTLHLMMPFLYTKVGIGAQYQIPRLITLGDDFQSSADYNQKFRFIPVYLVIQVPIHNKPYQFETIAEIGYSFLDGNKEYRSYEYYNPESSEYEIRLAKLSGSFHSGFGVSVQKNQFAYKIMFRCDHGFYKKKGSYQMNVENNYFGLEVEWRLSLDNVSKAAKSHRK